MMARATMEDSRRDHEAVLMEAVEVNSEVLVAAKLGTSRRQPAFRRSHSTLQAALQPSEATMAVWAAEVPVGAAATITFTVVAATKEQPASQLMVEMEEATITSTSLGSSTMSSTGRASSTKEAAVAMIASSSTRASSRYHLE